MSDATQQGLAAAEIHVLKVNRRGDRHDLLDLTIRFRLERETPPGEARSAPLPTGEALRDQVLALVRQHPIETLEALARTLADRLFRAAAAVRRVQIDLTEELWSRLETSQQPQPRTFQRDRRQKRLATLSLSRVGAALGAGVGGLELLKTDPSPADSPPPGDAVHGLPLGLSLEALWTYNRLDVAYNPSWHGIRRTLVESFASCFEPSPRQTLETMAAAVLANHPEVGRIELRGNPLGYRPAATEGAKQRQEASFFLGPDRAWEVVEVRLERED